tara:strand:+ start:426 stop:722 length:297 start_codon:yes stop_codon:yes gene_type:complete
MKQNTKLPSFNNFLKEEFVAAGFGPANPSPNIASSTRPITGYSMRPIVAYMDQLGSAAADEASTYENNDNPDHNGSDYITEAKKAVCSKIDEYYKKKK